MARSKKSATADSVAPAPEQEDDAAPNGLFHSDPSDLAATVEVAVATLTGDLRDFILDQLRHEQDKRPWDKRSESAQRDTVYAVEARVLRVVRQAVELIAGQGRKAIQAKLESITVKDGIKANVILSRFDAQRHSLIDACGASVLIVVADTDEFTGEREAPAIRPDQASLLGDVAVVHSPADNAATPFN